MKLMVLVTLLAVSVQAEPPILRNYRRFGLLTLPDQYGPPAVQPHPDATTNSTETPPPLTTTDRDTETIDAERAKKLNEKLVDGKKDIGTYYIYHPTGLLQKVSYSTKDDPRRMAFAAQLKYENVEPISGPVYTYDPENYVFKRLQ